MSAAMKLKGLILTSLFLTSLFVAALLAATLIAPVVLDQATVRAETTSRLSALSGGKVELSGPIRISYFPDVTFEAGKVSIQGLKRQDGVSGVTADKLSARLSWWQLLQGKFEIDELTLEGARLTVRSPSAKSASHEPSASNKTEWLDILKRAPVARLIVERGTIIFAREANEPEPANDAITDINASFSVKRGEGTVSGRGSFLWRQKKLAFDVATGKPLRVATTAKLPIELKLVGGLIKASLNGDLTIADGLQVSGQQDVRISDLRRFSAWLGYPIPPGRGLGTFTVAGAFSWKGLVLAYNNAAVTLDGNEAVGSLSLNLANSRPIIEGTLDLEELSLSSYFSNAPRPAKDDHTFRKFFDLTLLQYFDADLRLSSGKIWLGKPIAGRTAITLSVSSRQLVAEIAELEIFGGTATGHLEIDATTSFPRLVLKGNLAKISATDLISSFSAVELLKANADISFDISAQGRSLDHIVRSITGKASLKVNGDGIAMVNLKRVFSAAKSEILIGWNKEMLGETGFDSLEVSFAAKNGTIQSEDFIMKTGSQTYWGGGDIVLPTNTIDWRLCVNAASNSDKKSSDSNANDQVLTLSIRGPWSLPTIQLGGQMPTTLKKSIGPPGSKKDEDGLQIMKASPG